MGQVHSRVRGKLRAIGSLAAVASVLVLPASANAAPPTNDQFANAVTLAGDSGSQAGTLVEATAEVGEPAHAGHVALQSVWYSWTPSAAGLATIDTCASDFDTRLAVYTGSALASLTTVDASDNSNACGGSSVQSELSFVAEPGTRYSIVVDGFGGGGNVLVGWTRDPLAPINTAAPIVAGGTTDRDTLTATAGQWSAQGTVDYRYQWQRCGSTAGNVALGRPAEASNTFDPDHVPGRAVDGLTSTFWSSGDFAPQWLAIDLQAPYPLSKIRAAIAQLPDGNTVHDISVAGPNPGEDFFPLAHLAAFTTDRDPPLEATGPSNQVEYIRVDTSASPSWVAWKEIEALSRCADVSGATAPTYVVATADVGSAMRVVVRAANAAGTTAATSVETNAVAAARPANTRAPSVSGTANVGMILAADAGSWSGSEPIEYSYSWQRCKRGRCTTIDLETGDTYVVDSADGGSRVRVVVTAENAAGTASAASASTAVVPPVCAVPALRRKTLPVAKRVLAAAHCKLGRVSRAYSARVKRGRVVSQSPPAGREYARGHRVSVVISRGQRPRRHHR